MNESLTDIEALTLRCRSEQSKTYISEAVLCYRSGAYRASIVSIWIAVIFDLVDKIRELAVANESKAVAIWKKYETYIQQIENGNEQGVKSALEFERELIYICRKDLQFFDQQQMIDLQRLREDRHRCAHPSFQRIGEPYRPTAEQARLHLTNAVSHVLAQPPTQGKAQLARLLTLVSSNYFPLDVTQAVTQLRASVFGRANDALINGFVDMIVFDYIKSDSALHGKRQAGTALEASLEMYRPQVEARLAKQFNRVLQDAADSELGQVVFLVACVSVSWRLLQQPAREKVQQYVRSTPNSLVMPSLSLFESIPDFAEAIKAKVAMMTVDELQAAVSSFNLARFAKARALELVSGVRSYNAANDTINRIIFPIFDLLTKEDFVTLIQFPVTHGADLPGANAYSALIDRVRTTSMFDKQELNALLAENNAGWLVQET